MSKEYDDFVKSIKKTRNAHASLAEVTYKCNYRTWWSSHPFSNCQNFTIGAFNMLLDSARSCKLSNEDILEYIENIASDEDVRMLILDVQAAYVNKIRDIFKDKELVVDEPYESTNLSDMHLFCIRLNERDYPNDYYDDNNYDDDDY